MKNKKNIYFLLPAVLIIWGLLGYRIFSTVQPNNTSNNLTTSQVVFKPNEFKESKPFIVNLDYRDPFLGTTTTVKKTKNKLKIKAKPQPKKPFPQIVYKGVVSGTTNQVFIISIDGKQYFFKKNQMHNEIKLISGTSKSVSLKFQGQQQIFQIAK